MTTFTTDLLRGRNVLITGGGTGICRGIALAFARHGANIAVTSRKQENLDSAAHEIAALGVKSLALAADVRDPQQVEAAVAQVVEGFGGIDIVVNGAAGNFLAPVSKLSYNGFKTVIDIDLLGTYNVSKACMPHMQAERKPSFINISATLHYGATLMQSHVSAAKAGIDALTRNLALEWGPQGIRVNAIAPGPIGDTEGMRRLAPGEIGEKMAQAVPLKRLGRIDEIADAAMFLASDAAAYITGTILVVDGGRWLNNQIYDF
jgi:peroxisomal 2,4-dienoyl-CoA reductase